MPIALMLCNKFEALGSLLEVEPKQGMCFCWKQAWNFTFKDASVPMWNLLSNLLIKI